MADRIRRGYLIALLLSCVSVHARQAAPQELGWVGLFSPALVEWLENENQLETLCAAFKKDSDDWQQCRREKLAPGIRSL